MARSVLEIILSLKGDKARGELKKVDKSLEKVDKSAKKTGKGFKGLNTDLLAMGAAVGGAVFGAKKLADALWAMGKRGAAVEQTTESFDFLLNKLEGGSDILEKMRKESRGTVDDMTLMSSTMTLLAGTSDKLGKELLKNSPQLLKIAKAANKVNPTLGDTAFLYESITAGIKRNSKMVLDNLGIVFSQTTAYEEYAASIGKTVEQLDDEEKVLATLNAAMKSGNNLIAQAGGNVDALGDEMARAEVAAKNLGDEWSKFVAGPVAKVSTGLASALEGMNEHTQAYQALERAIAAGIITQEEANEVTEVGRGVTRDYASILDFITQKTEEYNEEIERVTSGLEYSKEAQRDFSWAMLESAEATEETQKAAEELARVLEEELNAEIRALQDLIGGQLGPELERFIEKNNDLQTEAEELGKAISLLKGEKYLSEEQKQELETLEEKLADVNRAIKENVLAHEEAQKKIVFNLLQQQAAADGYSENEVAALLTVAEQWGIIDEDTRIATENISEALNQLAEDDSLENFQAAIDDTLYSIGEDTDAMEIEIDDLTKKLTEMEGDYFINIKINQSGAIPKPPEGKGLPIGGQHGLDMIVPPGFKNDSYPIWTSSGEHVSVKTREQQKSDHGAVTININNPQISSEIDIDNMARQIAEVMRENAP